MKILICFLMLCVAIQDCIACSSIVASVSKPLRQLPEEYTKPEDLNFVVGDIISCKINLIASHVLLASSNSTVIHVVETEEDANGDGAAHIVEELLTEATKGLFEVCGVITDWYDDQVNVSCHEGQTNTTRSVEEVIDGARDSIKILGKNSTFYNLLDCNCEHWVASWRYGIAWTLQLGTIGKGVTFRTEYASTNCKAPGVKHCPQMI